MEQDRIASHDAGESRPVSTSKDATTKNAAVEVSEDGLAEEPKKYYSKLSIWLMILYSGLAIGSDG
jgi:hypothetical protein